MRHPLGKFLLVRLCAAAFIFVCAPCPAAFAGDELNVDESLTCMIDGLGRATMPTATLANVSDYDLTISSASAPNSLSWTCDAVGKTIPAHTSIAATWTANAAMPDNLIGLMPSTGPLHIGQVVYHYTYEKPIPVLPGALSIEGRRVTGSTLTAQASGIPRDAALSWQWYKDGTAIQGADSQSYTLQEDDDGHAIECRASDSNGAYSEDIRADAGTIELAFYLGYTMAETKTIADDIAKKGTASTHYAQMKQGLQDEAEGTMRLRNGRIYRFRLAGILHDTATSGGKAGLTFVGRFALPKAGQMNAESTNVGGWEACALRESMNSGEHWQLLSDEFQRSVCSVEKTSNNDRGSNSAAQTSTTSDKVWLLSLKEIAGSSVVDAYRDSGPWLGEEGAQYEYFRTYFQSASDRPEELCRTMCIYYDKTMPEGSRGMWFRLRSPMANNDIRWYTATQAGRADAFAYAYLMYAITPGWSMGEAN